MKSILYVGAVLMTGACIYGFVDYRKVNNNAEFKSLYRSEAATTKASPSDEQVSDVKDIEKVNEKTISSLPAPATKLTAGAKLEPAKELKEGSTGSKRKSTKRKKVYYKLYSRAALEERPLKVPEEKIEITEKK
jgi:uncharacterized protein HemX